MQEAKVLHVDHKGQLPVHVGDLIGQSTLEYIVLSEVLPSGLVVEVILEGNLSPLLLWQEVIALGVVPRLHDLY